MFYQKDTQYFHDFEKSEEVEANVNTKLGSKKKKVSVFYSEQFRHITISGEDILKLIGY